ncbi:MAG: phospho-N-acetylmuramoyl-pentapeptide-transferase [Lachnospiraceae bacterium]|nr:phospho-N-acetylmuramoyl-pentapeptide-transferase [Lachnospiraceae bacterium]
MFLNHILHLVVAFVLTVLIGKFLIPELKKLKARQVEREEGPESHKKKTGTPTMGGIMFLLTFAALTIPEAGKYRAAIPVIVATLGFGAVGLIDDYIKVVMKRNLGLRAWQKLVLQIVVSAAVIWSVKQFTEVNFDVLIPFSSLFTANGSGLYVNLGVFTVPFLIFVFLGTTNGSNFTDGLDGLLSSVTIVIALFIAHISSALAVNITSASYVMAGALLGFLFYNHHPAKVFMGDTGSLALGGFTAACMLVMKMPIHIVFVGIIYLVEVISVIIQVLYFKATHGKRFFKMAPIHHHFELMGWSETKVVNIFTIVTVVGCFIAIILM